MKHFIASLLDQLLYLAGALTAALLTRYLLDIAKPRDDYRVLLSFMGEVTTMFDLVDPLENANKQRLMHLRRRYFEGHLSADTSPMEYQDGAPYTIRDVLGDIEQPQDAKKEVDDNGGV